MFIHFFYCHVFNAYCRLYLAYVTFAITHSRNKSTLDLALELESERVFQQQLKEVVDLHRVRFIFTPSITHIQLEFKLLFFFIFQRSTPQYKYTIRDQALKACFWERGGWKSSHSANKLSLKLRPIPAFCILTWTEKQRREKKKIQSV